MKSANAAIENYINGNLTDAKVIAKRVAESILFATLQDDYGKTADEALTIARYLKGKETFQRAADSEAPADGPERDQWLRTHNSKPL